MISHYVVWDGVSI